MILQNIMDLIEKKIKDQLFWIHSKTCSTNGFRTTSYHLPNSLDEINKKRQCKIYPSAHKTIGGIFSFGQDYDNILIAYTDNTIDNITILPDHIIDLVKERFKITPLPPVEEPTHQSPQTSPKPDVKPLVQQPSYSEQ